MIFLILLIRLFLPASIFAAPQISVISLPSEAYPLSNFPVSFLVTNAGIGLTYYYKFFGGIGDSTGSIKTTPDLSYNSAWINFPKFISDLGASAIINSTAFVIPEVIEGIYNFKIKVALVSNTGSGATSPTYPLSVVIPEPTPTCIPTPIDTPRPTAEAISPIISPEPTIPIVNPLILSEIMANSNISEDEWIEIYNPSDKTISLKNLCFYDASLHPRCFSDDEFIGPNSYYSHSFSSGFLNNDGDTVTFLNTSIIYPSSPKNFTYSRQSGANWCFTDSSQNALNNNCNNDAMVSSEASPNFVSPLLNLQFSPNSVTAGDDFNLVFSLNSADPYSLRLISPFGSQYFPFSNFKDGYSWLTLPLSVSKKLPSGNYPLSFHLKKAGSSHLFDYQLGNINVEATVPSVRSSSKITKSKVLGTSTYSCPQCLDNSANVNYFPASTLRKVLPDANFFSWPFLFAGSILFLSPLLFPKLYSV